MFKDLLPLGSVVLVKEALKKAVIIGYKQIGAKDPNKIYDYVSVVYPIGSFGAESQFLFNHSDIQDIIFTGYKNPEFDEMIEALEKKAEEDPDFAETIRTGQIKQEN
ncbi:MAG: DUF4176 domain-containing protein [Ruminococcus sp.]|nr:DUF4176 domain-containing protein [Ruminococcus sp.]